MRQEDNYEKNGHDDNLCDYSPRGTEPGVEPYIVDPVLQAIIVIEKWRFHLENLVGVFQDIREVSGGGTEKKK